MKKFMLFALVMAGVYVASAQQKKVVKDEKTVKKTSTVPQKVHNTFSKNKEHNGTKTKHVKTTETKTP